MMEEVTDMVEYAYILSFIITMSLKKNTQFVCLIGIFPALLFTILYISEDKPLGMLYSIFS